MAATSTTRIFRGDILHFLNAVLPEPSFVQNGAMAVVDGKVSAVGPADEIIASHPDAEVTDYSGKIITPGFIDTHVHYPQTGIIAAYGEQLLEWLDKYTFPAEKKFADKSHADKVAKVFVNELLRSGTTTALVFSTVHKESVDAFFEASEALNLRMISGKVMMDREPFAPEGLRDTVESGYEDSKALIAKWHGKARLSYAVTPRFAITSTEEQLASAGRLLKEHPDVYMHTHMCENKNEIDLVKDLFKSEDYVTAYSKHGLLGPRSVFAHCVHMQDQEWAALRDSKSAIAFCPTSNFFLGSGTFDFNRCEKEGVRVGLGTDVGAGTSFCQLQTLGDAYKAMAIQGQKLSCFQALHLATIRSAAALSLDDKIGNFAVGKEADFIVLDPSATPLTRHRTQSEGPLSLHDTLFLLMTVGDDRTVLATHIMGDRVHHRDQAPR